MSIAWMFRTGVVAAVVLAVAGVSRAQFVGYPISLSSQADPLIRPIGVTHAPGDYRRVFVWQKGGQIRTIDLTQPNPVTQPSATPFLNLVGAVPALPSAPFQVPSSNGDERGLLGLAFHPQYQTNGKFYVYYTSQPVATGGGANAMPTNFNYYQNIVEFIVRDPGTLIVNPSLATADIASARSVMRIQHPLSTAATNHNGGCMHFGPDGYLYITVGDGGNFGDQGTGHNATIGNAQDTGLPLGKMLRIDVNSVGPAPQGPFWTSGSGLTAGAANYGIPASNPVVPVVAGGATPSRNEIWAYGLRNTWRFSFDRLTGDIWLGDVGQDKWEEIDFQAAYNGTNGALVAGRNYGWRCWEGTAQYPTTSCGGAYNTGGNVGPLGVYPHAATTNTATPLKMTTTTGANIVGISITGGYVYRGCRIPELYGQYVFTDYNLGSLYTTTINGGTGFLNAPVQWNGIYSGSAAVQPNVPAGTGSAGVVSFGEDAYGEMYVVIQSPANVFKLVSTNFGQIPLANPDYNRNGVLSVQDIFDYLNSWFSGVTNTDYNRDGTLSVQDIFDYLIGWFGGCAG